MPRTECPSAYVRMQSPSTGSHSIYAMRRCPPVAGKVVICSAKNSWQFSPLAADLDRCLFNALCHTVYVAPCAFPSLSSPETLSLKVGNVVSKCTNVHRGRRSVVLLQNFSLRYTSDNSRSWQERCQEGGP